MHAMPAHKCIIRTEQRECYEWTKKTTQHERKEKENK